MNDAQKQKVIFALTQIDGDSDDLGPLFEAIDKVVAEAVATAIGTQNW